MESASDVNVSKIVPETEENVKKPDLNTDAGILAEERLEEVSPDDKLKNSITTEKSEKVNGEEDSFSNGKEPETSESSSTIANEDEPSGKDEVVPVVIEKADSCKSEPKSGSDDTTQDASEILPDVAKPMEVDASNGELSNDKKELEKEVQESEKSPMEEDKVSEDMDVEEKDTEKTADDDSPMDVDVTSPVKVTKDKEDEDVELKDKTPESTEPSSQLESLEEVKSVEREAKKDGEKTKEEAEEESKDKEEGDKSKSEEKESAENKESEVITCDHAPESKTEEKSHEKSKADDSSEAPKNEKESENSIDSKPKTPSSDKKSKKKHRCEECGAKKGLKFQMLFQGKTRYMCSGVCFKSFKEKQMPAKAKEKTPPPVVSSPATPKPAEKEHCGQCKKEIKNNKAYYPRLGETKPICSEDCLINYQESNVPKKKCSQCKAFIEDDMSCLTWETMDYCNEDCLGKFQAFLGSHCTCCQSPVQQTSLGKYSVCFGSDIRQFCSGTCLEEFKKGLKVCSFCQKDLSSGVEGFLAPVGDKGQFKDFCTQQCMERYETMNSNNSVPQPQQCSFCSKAGIFKIQTKHGEETIVLCSNICVAGYRYKHKVALKVCDTCYKFFDPEVDGDFSLQFEGVFKYYCTKACMTLYVLSHRKIVPCSWCKVKKYNFDMIEKLDSSNQTQTYCSLNCISLYRVSLNATSAKSIRCDNCSKNLPAQYHLTMSDGSIRNFCMYQCVIQFQNQFTSVPTLTTSANRQQNATPQVTVAKATPASNSPVISNVMSLASTTPRTPGVTNVGNKIFPPQKGAPPRQSTPSLTIIAKAPNAITSPTQSSATVVNTSTSGSQVVREVIVKPPAPKSLKNKAILCKPIMHAKAVSCKPHPCHKAVQTDEGTLPMIVPIPVPIYVPTPVHMFSRPVPCPIPFPVPIPVPIFVPTNKNCPTQIVKKLKDIQERMPSNPYEAELLMMAEMVAENNEPAGQNYDVANSPPNLMDDEASHIPKRDAMLPPDVQLDLETALPPGIAPVIPKKTEVLPEEDEEYFPKESSRQPYGKRSATSHGRGRGRGKRSRVEIIPSAELDSFSSMPLLEDQLSAHNQDPQDSSSRLKYTFGVNAWKHWVLQKNTQLEKGSQSSRKFKLFKTDLLQLPPDELNYSLCLFVKEIRKPTGEEYAPASIYYLCLGIQQYLFENGRIDNIFTDPYYEKFTECLNDVLRSQEDMMMSDAFFISRIEEEVLWESKQLGAHSPHVLLNTLMYFNAKHFNLRSVDDHTHLSFSHVTKHWRKTPVKSGPRSVVLRYYPPANKDHPRRRKEDNSILEQSENLDNPLRCPVKLYEFYLSKCPESVRTRNDVFYMYPERSCVPDSPVWYSTQPLAREMITKMLQRIKTIREIYEP